MPGLRPGEINYIVTHKVNDQDSVGIQHALLSNYLIDLDSRPCARDPHRMSPHQHARRERTVVFIWRRSSLHVPDTRGGEQGVRHGEMRGKTAFKQRESTLKQR